MRWGLQSVTYFTCRFISQDFFYARGISIFRNISEHMLFNFFLECNVPNKNLPFCFFVSSKIQTSCTSFLQTELGICLILPDVSRKYSPAFQNIEVAFERCSTKVVAQQDLFSIMQKYIHSTIKTNKYKYKVT